MVVERLNDSGWTIIQGSYENLMEIISNMGSRSLNQGRVRGAVLESDDTS